MTARRPHARPPPRHRQPELEHDFARNPALSYEPPQDVGLIRCLDHGFPTRRMTPSEFRCRTENRFGG